MYDYYDKKHLQETKQGIAALWDAFKDGFKPGQNRWLAIASTPAFLGMIATECLEATPTIASLALGQVDDVLQNFIKFVKAEANSLSSSTSKVFAQIGNVNPFQSHEVANNDAAISVKQEAVPAAISSNTLENNQVDDEAYRVSFGK